MAQFFQDRRAAEPGVRDLFLRFAVGASGAVGAVTRNRGLGTPVRTGTGTYSIPLSDAYFALLEMTAQVEGATVGSGAAGRMRLVSETLTGASKAIVIEGLSSADAVADVASGNTIVLHLTMKKASF